MSASSFDLFLEHFRRPPSIVVEWHDDRVGPLGQRAKGWLCIDQLRGRSGLGAPADAAAGGGTRLRTGGTREEAIFLAKTMGIKFRVCGPNIGGGKSVIDYTPESQADKHAVLERWYRHIAPYLKSCYGTGGDVGVDEVSDATVCIERATGIKHPQAGIITGHYAGEAEPIAAKIDRMRHGVEAPVILEGLPGSHKTGQGQAWLIADVATGVGVVRCLERYYEKLGRSLAGQRIIIEGFGAVGAFAAYYLDRLGAKTVSASTAGPASKGGVRIATDQAGLNVNALVQAAMASNRTLPEAGHAAYGKSTRVIDAPTGEVLFDVQADIFIPAARSHTINSPQLESLKKAGVKVWSCGANNPFWYDPRHAHGYAGWVEQMTKLMREADPHFAIIPDFVANSGMARTFAYLMEAGTKADAISIIKDIRENADRGVDRVMDGAKREHGLLDRGLAIYAN
jgi:glutamate dehydrogenase/leucine dehydrogenase